MSKKTVRFLFILTLISLAGCRPASQPNPAAGDCLSRMAEETAAYVRERKIPLKGGDAKLYGNKEEQVYLLSSQEPVKLGSSGSAKTPVALIQHKDSSGKNSFYLLEQEITPEKITFILSQDSKVFESLPVKLVLPRASVPITPDGPGGECKKYCDSVEADNDAQLQALLAEANRTCSEIRICLPFCNCVGGVPHTAWALYLINPTSWRCWRVVAVEREIAHPWPLPDPGPFLDQAFNAALKKTASLYTP